VAQAVAWQSEKLEGANFPNFAIAFLCFWHNPLGTELAVRKKLCKFVAG